MKRKQTTQEPVNQNIEEIVENMSNAEVKETDDKALIKKSKGMKAIASILYILSFAVIFALTFILGIKTYSLVPYYSFWPFLGVIFTGVLAVAFLAVTFTVSRRKTKRSIRYQSVAILVTYFCLTSVFALVLDTVFPDILNLATQGTLHADDMYLRGDDQIEENAALNRQFIRYNILNGNMTPEYSYHDMSALAGEGASTTFVDPQIETSYNAYMRREKGYINSIIKQLTGLKKELFDSIYNDNILLDINYSFDGNNYQSRQSLALAMCDKTIDYYVDLCNQGFKNERLEYLRQNNFTSMDQDGYATFDDPLLLFAQMEGRMTIPVVVRLILDETYMYSQPIYEAGNPNPIGYDGYLYEIYDPEYVFANWDGEGNPSDPALSNEKIQISNDGYIMYENGYVKKPMKWCVLDMDGNVMSVVDGLTIDLTVSGMDVGALINIAFSMPQVKQIIDDLLNGALPEVINIAANGAQLKIGFYLNDDGGLSFAVVPSNAAYGVLGYKQMSWMNSNNLLMGIVTLMSNRNNLYIFGAIGLFFVVAANMLREQSSKVRGGLKNPEAFEKKKKKKA